MFNKTAITLRGLTATIDEHFCQLCQRQLFLIAIGSNPFNDLCFDRFNVEAFILRSNLVITA